MRGRIALGLRFSPILLVLALAACGGGTKTVTVTETRAVTTTAAGQKPVEVRVFFLRDGKVAAAGRTVTDTAGIAGAALAELSGGPTAAERGFGFTSVVPRATLTLNLLDGVVHLGYPGVTFSHQALAQVVYTLTQFPQVRAVELAGKRYTRADFEDVTPPILVESPTPGEEVTSPLRARGTANTFEATFQYELSDADGKIVAQHFVTATSGSGTRGTFDFLVPFQVARDGPGALTVFERSAADGSRIHEVKIPIRLEK